MPLWNKSRGGRQERDFQEEEYRRSAIQYTIILYLAELSLVQFTLLCSWIIDHHFIGKIPAFMRIQERWIILTELNTRDGRIFSEFNKKIIDLEMFCGWLSSGN